MSGVVCIESVGSPHLLPGEVSLNLRTLLTHQPWKSKYSLKFTLEDGFTQSQLQGQELNVAHEYTVELLIYSYLPLLTMLKHSYLPLLTMLTHSYLPLLIMLTYSYLPLLIMLIHYMQRNDTTYQLHYTAVVIRFCMTTRRIVTNIFSNNVTPPLRGQSTFIFKIFDFF